MSHTPTDCQRMEAWYESQTEETLRDLFDRFDAVSPRECWHAFFNDCALPAQQRPSDSLAAPAEAGQEVCTQQIDAVLRPLLLQLTSEGLTLEQAVSRIGYAIGLVGKA